MKTSRTALLAALAACALPAAADLAISAHDTKVYNENGVVKTYATPAGDNVAIIDLAASPPKVIAEVKVPTSVVGPPVSVAITRDESLAFVTAAQKLDPADSTKTIADNKLSVIDLKALKVVAPNDGTRRCIHEPAAPRARHRRSEGTISVFDALKVPGRDRLGDASGRRVVHAHGKRTRLARQRPRCPGSR
jgi:hypothetical protein